MARLILLNMPIGDMADMTSRVRDALQTGECFAVEDTRSFREVLGRLGVSSQDKHILSLHDQSSEAKFERLLDVIHQGRDLYVVSEAGSPVLSDPAYPLVKLAYEKGVSVDSYSGISAVTMALELSGLPPLPFHFHGFLPRDAGRIRAYFSTLGSGTHIFFEAPNRVKETIDEARGLWPEASLVVIKEMCKTFQRVYRFSAGKAPAEWGEVVERGEFVWLVHLEQDMRPRVPRELTQLAEDILVQGAGNKAISRLLGEILDRPAKEIYSLMSRNLKD